MFLQTKRLNLRDFKENDIDNLYDYRNNEKCYKYQRGQKRQLAELIELIANTCKLSLINDNEKQYAIALNENDELIGDLVIFLKEDTITVGYTISYKHQRKGYAFEILTALIEYLHNEYPEKEIVALTDKDNEASISLLKKLNFKDEGYHQAIDSFIFSKYSK